MTDAEETRLRITHCQDNSNRLVSITEYVMTGTQRPLSLLNSEIITLDEFREIYQRLNESDRNTLRGRIEVDRDAFSSEFLQVQNLIPQLTNQDSEA